MTEEEKSVCVQHNESREEYCWSCAREGFSIVIKQECREKALESLDHEELLEDFRKAQKKETGGEGCECRHCRHAMQWALLRQKQKLKEALK